MLTPATFKVEITQVAINRRMGSKKGAIFLLRNTQSNEKGQTTDRCSLCMNQKKNIKLKLRKDLSEVRTVGTSVGSGTDRKGTQWDSTK